MDTFRTHFSYEKNLDNAFELFEDLSRELKIIHNHNMVVPNINSDEIFFGESMYFKPVRAGDDFQIKKRQNIVDFSKLMIGTYISVNAKSFKDYSNFNDQWFIDNFDTIFQTINEENFDKEYFSSVLLEGKDYYYSDYLDRKRQSESLEGKSNVQGYAKVLKGAGWELYQGLEEETEVKEKNANIKVTFNPLLIGISLAIITILLIMLALVK